MTIVCNLDDKVIAFTMLPLRYGSVLTNIILIAAALRLSIDSMVWVSAELFQN